MEQANKPAEAPADGNAPFTQSAEPATSSSAGTIAAPKTTATETAPTAVEPPPWPIFLRTAKPQEIRERFVQEVEGILRDEGVGTYCCLGLLEPDDSINAGDLDAIFSALSSENAQHEKDVLLLLLCRGGSIEPAYQVCPDFCVNGRV